MKRFLALMLTFILILITTACDQQPISSSIQEPPSISMLSSAPESAEMASRLEILFDAIEEGAEPSAQPVNLLPTPKEYVQQVVQETIAQITHPGMSEFEKTKAAFDYLIEIGDYQWPILLDIWRIRSDDSVPPDYVETRALNFLLTGVGACEDYASALVMLLEGMGIEARYLPGVTWGRNGGLIYHAWTQAKVDGVWYHLDCELEDGISNGTVRYRYFMKSNATMSASHYWGQNFINLGGLQPDQVEEITQHYLGEDCPQDYPTPASTQILVTPRKDPDSYVAQIQPELEAYEAAHGPLSFREFEVDPPVFGRYGGYRPSGITQQSDWILRGSTAHNLVPWQYDTTQESR